MYLFRSELLGLTKIGHSKWPGTRHSEIRCHVPDAACVGVVGTDDGRWLEGIFHTCFAHRRKHGEWFALTEWDMAALKSCPEYISEEKNLPPVLAALLSVHYVTSKFDHGGPNVPVRLSAWLALAIFSTAALRGVPAGHYLTESLLPKLERDLEAALATADPTLASLVRDAMTRLPKDAD